MIQTPNLVQIILIIMQACYIKQVHHMSYFRIIFASAITWSNYITHGITPAINVILARNFYKFTTDFIVN